MKKIFVFVLIHFIIISYAGAQNAIEYLLEISNPNVEAIDSYPQKIVSIEKNESSSTYFIKVNSADARSDSAKLLVLKDDVFDNSYKYSNEIKEYLSSTTLIDVNNPIISSIADTLFRDETNTLALIKKALGFTSSFLTFDNDLAMDIANDKSKTLSVGSILEKRKGTCSEYTNLFIALMRNIGIPTRFVAGYIYLPENNFRSGHAWAECYVNGYGWLPVDPQNNFCPLPPVAIKLVYGKDYVDCNLKTFRDLIPLSIERLNEKK